ncbi:MAG TPA: 16S rRNA (cytosine(967)-C(5))-methyltransferase RsmB [Caldimonas sp.]|nr:16S rRNA (cytosine(967)-C(5))-methyltransferase RsmB [Caldimonas sp.]HEV7576604.1 16S rRNA (cytosine(967)-C(5))-methyltransferase RsmB [Caldimonas sp.]
MTGPASTAALPLARLLGHSADAVAMVRAGQSLNDALARCPAPARPGTQALAFHALRWLGAAEVVRHRLAPKTPPPGVDSLLLTALALLWPPGDPPYAEHTLVDQAVAAATKRAPRSAGFVNAVLRRFLREREAIVAAALEDPLARFNHPGWWLDRLRADWPGRWAAIADADNAHPPMTLRVNARRTTANEYVATLAAHGIDATPLDGAAVALARPVPVTQLPGFAAGLVSVQDANAQRAAPLLLARPLAPGARVLDACAAPGGKTAHLLELADLELLAIDRDAARLARVDATLARLGLRAETRVADAAEPARWWDGRPFAAILLDAPCSASGIVRRHPDVRWLRRASDLPALAATQARLLDALWPLLAPGGRLLYATCSVFRSEGSAQIDAFLQRAGDAALAATPPSPGQLLPLPDNDETPSAPASPRAADGFFLALIEKLPSTPKTARR